VEIDEIPLGEVERYAGRVVVGKVTPEGELIEARFVGGPGRIGGKTSQEKARSFTTVKEAEEAGFTYLPYETAVQLKAQAAYKRVADKKTADWILANLPEGVSVKGGAAAFEDATSNLPAFRGRVFTGPKAHEFANDLDRYFKQPEVNSFLNGVNKLNSVQRMFALVGDASPFMIQMLASAYRHPSATFKSGRDFARVFVTALSNPAAARRIKANL